MMECPLFGGGGCSAQTIHPSRKLTYDVGMSTNPQMIPVTQNCDVWAVLWQQALHSKIPLLGAVLGLAIPLHENSAISDWCTLRHTNLCLLFQTWSKLVQDKCPKGRIVLVTEKKTKHVLAPFDRNPGVISPKNNYAGANNVPHLYSRFHPNPFRFGGVITKRTRNPQSKCKIGSSSLQ